MPKVKIFLAPNESIEDAEELLRKALNLHANGDVHVEESFDDPAMIDTQNRMENIHKQIYKEMVDEIIEELDKEY